MPVILPPPIPPIIFTPHMIHSVSSGGGEDDDKLFLNSIIATGVIGVGAFVYIHFKYRNPFKGIHKESRDLQLYARYLNRFQERYSYTNIGVNFLNSDKDSYMMYRKHHPKYYTSSKKAYYTELMKKDPKELIPEEDFKKLFKITEDIYNEYSNGNLYGATPEDYRRAKVYFLVAKKFDEDFGRPRNGEFERMLERIQSYIEYKRDSRH
jgi:hypothetical protein